MGVMRMLMHKYEQEDLAHGVRLPHTCDTHMQRHTASIPTPCDPAPVLAQCAADSSPSGEAGGGSATDRDDACTAEEDSDVVKSRVIFRLVHGVAFGEQIKVVGDGPALGDWDINAAPSAFSLASNSRSCAPL